MLGERGRKVIERLEVTISQPRWGVGDRNLKPMGTFRCTLKREYTSDWEEKGYLQIMLLLFLLARLFVCLLTEFQLILKN